MTPTLIFGFAMAVLVVALCCRRGGVVAAARGAGSRAGILGIVLGAAMPPLTTSVVYEEAGFGAPRTHAYRLRPEAVHILPDFLYGKFAPELTLTRGLHFVPFVHVLYDAHQVRVHLVPRDEFGLIG